MKHNYIFKTKQGCVCKIIKYINATCVLVEFQDAFKYRTITSARSIRNGQVKNKFHPCVEGVGYLGHGKYKSKDPHNAMEAQCYNMWHKMITRVYSGKQSAYAMCVVCDSWLNYQNFAVWYHDNYRKGWALDKDILIENNKIYSPITCIFVPQWLNNVFSGLGRESPSCGVCEASGRYIARTSQNGKQLNIGSFDTLAQARAAYLTTKRRVLIQYLYHRETPLAVRPRLILEIEKLT